MTLAPVPVSNRDARRFLRHFLDDNGLHGDFADSAELALSEVVTNAVLHAHTEFEVALHLADGVLRVAVTDRNPQLPVQRRYADQATTGRGMDLVAAYARDCGVDAGPDGKIVWFVVDRPLPTDAQQEQALLDAWVLDLDDATHVAAGSGSTVVLLSLPPMLWLAARQHHDAVLRELSLYVAAHPENAPAPDRIALADSARAWITTQLVVELDRLAASAAITHQVLPDGHPSRLPDTPASLDLEVPVPDHAADAFAALQDVLDVAETLAARGLLLARPGLPEIVAVRDWACEQGISQHSGVLPSPWPGTGQERFILVHDRHEPAPLEWDTRLVSDADRGAVAADANRVIAISRPLADALGWDVDDLVGRRVVVLIPPELREAHVAGFTRHLTTGETHAVGVPLRLPVLRADGTRVECGFLIEQLPPTPGRAVYIAWIDPDR